MLKDLLGIVTRVKKKKKIRNTRTFPMNPLPFGAGLWAPGAMLAYLAASGVLLTHLRRPLGQYTVRAMLRWTLRWT